MASGNCNMHKMLAISTLSQYHLNMQDTQERRLWRHGLDSLAFLEYALNAINLKTYVSNERCNMCIKYLENTVYGLRAQKDTTTYIYLMRF